MKLSSLSANQYFAQSPPPDIQRSTFDRSAGNKFDFDAGYNIPFYADEILPGDTFQARLDLFARFNTPIKPIMDNVYLDVHFFAVPLRLIWDNFHKFMGEKKNPADSTDYLTPKLTDIAERYFTPHSNFDYMGLPTFKTGIFHHITAFHSRAIHLIWNEFYRDQNFDQSLPVPTDDGPDNIEYNLYQFLTRRNKRKDYFTSAFPWAQKGPSILIPPTHNGFVNIQSNGNPIQFSTSEASNHYFVQKAGTYDIWTTAPTEPSDHAIQFGSSVGLMGAINQNTTSTINALREAFQLQRFLERDARGGTRYTETVFAHFRVESPDSRLQRPEYLGGGTLNLNINPVTQTAPSLDNTTPQGNLAAFGTVSTQSSDIGFTYSSTEHQVLLGFISARADLSYQQGLPRMWSRNTKYDFYWPEFAHLGEQAILQKEIHAKSTDDSYNNQIFGYQERYAEYKYRQSIISGSLKSNFPQTLDSWHLAQEFNESVVLGPSFIKENPPIARTVAVPSEKDFICDTFLHLNCTRPMPVNAIPGMADHF